MKAWNIPIKARRPSSVLASVLAAGLMLTVAGCSNITPLGPGAAATTRPMPPARHLGWPMILQVMRSQPPTITGGCRAGLVEVFLPPGAPAMPCFRPLGTPVTITSAAVSPVSAYRHTPPPGQPAPPTSYGFMVGVPTAQVAAVTALVMQAYDAHGALGVSVDGKLWQAAQIVQPFPGQQFQIALLTRNQALQLYRLLVPAS